MNRKKCIRETVNYVILGLVGLFILIPLVHMVVTSLKSNRKSCPKETSPFPAGNSLDPLPGKCLI